MRCTCVHSIHALRVFFLVLVCSYALDFTASSKPSITVNLLICTLKVQSLFRKLSPEFIQVQAVTHLEEVILVDDTAVGQVLDESVGEGGFPSIGNAARNKAIIK